MSTILYNGHIYQERNTFTEALLIENGNIVSCGTSNEILAQKNSNCELIDLQGKTVVPGFNDSHLHFYMSAVAFTTVDLYGLSSTQAVIQRATEFLNTHPEAANQPLFGRGWNQDYFLDEARLLNRFDLDQISTQIPIVFDRACGHVMSCNTRALEVCNITAATPQPDGGQFDFDELGEPLGIFRENALGLLQPLQQPLSVENQVKLIETVSAVANSFGITSVQTNDLTIGSSDALSLEEAFRLVSLNHPTVRVYHQISFTDIDTFSQRINDGYDRGLNDFNRYGPLKIFVDGSLGARTALMSSPYEDDPTTQGITCMTVDQLNQFVQIADRNQIQVAVHAIGDGAMTMVLDAYSEVIQPTNNLRHGIVHCQITDLPLLNRFQSLDVVAYVQPIFLHYDMHIVENRVGQLLASTSYAFNTMEKLGLHVAYGTDSPVEGLNVFHNIHCAVNRQDLNLFPENGFYPTECVDLSTAIDNLTIGSAYASFEEDRKGRLKPGYMADLVVVSQSIFDLDPTLLKDVSIDMTMVNGRVVYTR